MDNQPLVSVNILSYNRKNELRNTITHVLDQDYKNIEVIVVDNASMDGSREMIKTEFPRVLLIELPENVGIAGWNEGFKAAKGEYVLVLDDDAYPDMSSLSKSVRLLEENKGAACVAFNIIDISTKTFFWANTWLPSDEILGNIIWPVFIGCAVLFSQKKLKFISPMPTNYFLYQHELPVSARIYKLGYDILFNREILAYHNCKEPEYNDENQNKIVFKNNLLFVKSTLPNPIRILYKLQLYLFFITRAINNGWFNDYLKIIKENKKLKVTVEPMKIGYFMKLRKLHLFNLSILSKYKYFIK